MPQLWKHAWKVTGISANSVYSWEYRCQTWGTLLQNHHRDSGEFNADSDTDRGMEEKVGTSLNWTDCECWFLPLLGTCVFVWLYPGVTVCTLCNVTDITGPGPHRPGDNRPLRAAQAGAGHQLESGAATWTHYRHLYMPAGVSQG